MKPLWVLVPSLLALSACVTLPEVYAPPIQRKPALSEDAPRASKRLLRMVEPETDAYIVQDLPRGVSGPWRWAGPRPIVRIYLTSVADSKILVEYSVAEATFKVTGPVNFKFFVNEKLLGEAHHDKPGAYVFEKAVPAQMLKANAENDLAVEVDKPWTSPEDGAKLGFILTSIGFAR
jgi:hypothetical protein